MRGKPLPKIHRDLWGIPLDPQPTTEPESHGTNKTEEPPASVPSVPLPETEAPLARLTDYPDDPWDARTHQSSPEPVKGLLDLSPSTPVAGTFLHADTGTLIHAIASPLQKAKPKKRRKRRSRAKPKRPNAPPPPDDD
jgi:hypothetical protein